MGFSLIQRVIKRKLIDGSALDSIHDKIMHGNYMSKCVELRFNLYSCISDISQSRAGAVLEVLDKLPGNYTVT